MEQGRTSEVMTDFTEVYEISELKEATFVEKDPKATYYLSCGDDRNLTEESGAALAELGVESPDLTIRYYGAAIGGSRVVLTTLAEQYGEDGFDGLPDSFTEAVDDFARRAESSSKVRMTVHSAEKNEASTAHFDTDSTNGLGCAYAGGVKVVTELNQDKSVQTLAAAEFTDMSGESVAQNSIASANRLVSERFFSDMQSGLTRSDYTELGLPVAIHAGEHAHASEATVVVNFHADKVSNPRHANEEAVPYYDNDVTQMAEIILRAYPEYELDPETLLKVMINDIAATRQALASHDDLQASDLRLETYGSYHDAVAYLKALEI